MIKDTFFIYKILFSPCCRIHGAATFAIRMVGKDMVSSLLTALAHYISNAPLMHKFLGCHLLAKLTFSGRRFLLC
jgi:hypothetical protein